MRSDNFKNGRISSFSGRRRLFYVGAFAALAISLACGLFFAAGQGVATKASASEGHRYSSEHNDVRMLTYALNFRSAHNFALYADDGVVDNGNTIVRGNVGRDHGQNRGLRAENVRGHIEEPGNGLNARQVKEDLAMALSALRQLPCTNIQETDLGGNTFGPGTYCLASPSLAGQMLLDGDGNPNSIFIFRIKGGFETAPESMVSLVNGARASNAFFVADGDINIGSGSEINAGLIADGNVKIDANSNVGSKVLSLGARVTTVDSGVGDGTGFVEVCKQQRAGTTGLEGRIFTFNIGGIIRTVPVGQCSAPVEVAAGPVVISESQAQVNYRLFDVTSNVAGSIIARNLPAGQATVNVRAGTIANETIVTFINEFAIVGVVEICKRAVPGDPDVAGFFDFTIDAITGVVFTVPVGQCTGPITVFAPTTGGSPTATIRVTELAEPGFTLESATTFPASRFISLTLNQGVSNDGSGTIFANPGGGFATVTMQQGGTAVQTTVNFFNRTNPGQLKICKVAGPGIPEGTVFTFEVRGQSGPGAGDPVIRTVSVPAGPAAQGGFCTFVAGTFVIGSPILITETGPTTAGSPAGEVRVASIISSSGFSPAPATVQGITVNPNPDLLGRRAVVPMRAETTVVGFTNFVFRPAVLKVCKIAGPGVAVGTPFTFNITATQPNVPSLPAAITVQAGPAAQGGFCQFVNGPYPATAEFPGVGTFNIGSTVTAVETAVAGTAVTAITSPTGTVTGVNLATRTGSLAIAANVNELVFTNAAVVPPAAGFGNVRADFDADGMSNLAIFNAGSWTIRASGGNRTSTTTTMGATGDIMVPGDYDGDNKTDLAIYRNGTWLIQRSSNGSPISVAWGLPGDRPVAADYDGDGKTDIAAYRPSTGQWLIIRSTNGQYEVTTWGNSNDLTVQGDYDGDHKTDIAVYRPSNGTWYVLKSSGGGFAAPWGLTGDRPVQADYDGDGKVDISVYRPSTGTWFIYRSSDNGFDMVQWGNSTDIPVPGDYDHDGRYDMAQYRSNSGMWYILLSSGGYMAEQLGGSPGDEPVEARYIP